MTAMFVASDTLKRAPHTVAGPAPATVIAVRPVQWWTGWEALAVLPALAIASFAAAPRWQLMWALCLAIYAGTKWLTWRRTPVRCVPIWRHLAYLFAWPGMDARAFLAAPASQTELPRAGEWLFAVAKCLLGVGVFTISPRMITNESDALGSGLAQGWLGMIGIVLTLHFGLFHILSCVWRSVGVEARPLMHWPLAASSVSAFWGRRWNAAFRDLAHRFVFLPLAKRLGARSALVGGFLASGVAHEAVISFPAGGGYGGPTLFFFLQAVAMFIERSPLGQRIGLGDGRIGWTFTAVVLVAPVGLLFHPAFVRNVVLPFLEAWGVVS